MTKCNREERVPVGPFRDWLQEQVARTDQRVLADRWGVHDRQLYRVLHESTDWVSIDLVDKCLLNTPTLLEDLYPLEPAS